LQILLEKLEKVVKKIGKPSIASTNSAVMAAIGGTSRTEIARTLPVSEFLWDSNTMNGTVGWLFNQTGINQEMAGWALNPSQKVAVSASLKVRLSLIRGPPGTGKTDTLVAIIEIAVKLALHSNKPLRLCITAFTCDALGNLCRRLGDALQAKGIAVPLYWVHSAFNKTAVPSGMVDLSLPKKGTHPLSVQSNFFNALMNPLSPLVFASTTQQIHNIAEIHCGRLDKPLVDFLVVDEASQMGIANPPYQV
jgi:DNA replication ATP-dependent helicase Dna2